MENRKWNTPTEGVAAYGSHYATTPRLVVDHSRPTDRKPVDHSAIREILVDWLLEAPQRLNPRDYLVNLKGQS